MILQIKDTPRPLLHEIVEIPDGIAVPLAFIDQRGREMPCKVGRIIEVQPTLISVQFFGYPTPWDYSMREAQYFTLNPYQP